MEINPIAALLHMLMEMFTSIFSFLGRLFGF